MPSGGPWTRRRKDANTVNTSSYVPPATATVSSNSIPTTSRNNGQRLVWLTATSSRKPNAGHTHWIKTIPSKPSNGSSVSSTITTRSAKAEPSPNQASNPIPVSTNIPTYISTAGSKPKHPSPRKSLSYPSQPLPILSPISLSASARASDCTYLTSSIVRLYVKISCMTHLHSPAFSCAK